MSDETRWLDPEAAARYLSVRADALSRLVRMGRIPAPELDSKTKKLRWNENQIDEQFLSGIVPPKRLRKDAERYAGQLRSACSLIDSAQPWAGDLCGIYFLIADGEIIYVGQSVNVANRILQHAVEHSFNAWSWVRCRQDDLDIVERAYIDAFMPPLNRDATTRRIRKARG